MLQIILFVLKVLGWILLIVLGLLVLVFLLVLFTPLRYQVEARCRGKLSTLEAGVRFHLFFHLVSGALRFEKKKLTWNIRAAWIKLGNSGEAVHEEETKEKEEDAEEIEEAKEKEADAEGIQDAKREEADTKDIEKIDTNVSCSIKEELKEASSPDEIPDDTDQELKKTDAETLDIAEQTKTTSTCSEEQKKNSSEEDEGEAQNSLFDKIASIFEKIKYTFSGICDKIRVLSKKAEEIKAFFENDTHQSAFLKLLVELKKMLFRMRPKQVDGNLKFGFEDPSITGRVLAGLSMIYPYWEIQLEPDFGQKVLDGGISVRGSAQLWPMAALAWNMVWNRDVRRTVLDFKKMMFK